MALANFENGRNFDILFENGAVFAVRKFQIRYAIKEEDTF